MSTRMIARNGARSHEVVRQFFAGSPVLIYAQQLRAQASRTCQRVLVRPAKQLHPLVSPQALSDLRQHGGRLGDLDVLMLAAPEAAQEIAAHIQSVADLITEARAMGLDDALSDEIVADAQEDIAQDHLRRHPNDIGALRDYIAAAEEAQAKLRVALAAARRRLHELERAC